MRCLCLLRKGSIGFYLAPFFALLIFCVILNGAYADGLTDKQLADLAYKEGQKKELARNWQDAMAYYEEAVKRDEQKPQYHYKLAFVLTRQEPPQRDKAIRILNKVVKKIDKKHKESYARLGLIYLEESDLKNARIAFSEASKIDPNFALSYYGLGKTAKRRYEQSQDEIDKLEAIGNFQEYLKLGGEFSEEVREYLRVLEYGELGIQLNRAIALLRHPDYVRAKLFLDNILAASPSLQEAHYWLGVLYSIYEATPYYDETGLKSEKEWLQAPDVEAARVQLGIWYHDTGQLENATRQLEAAFERNPRCQKAYYYLGLISFEEGEEVQAIDYFGKAIESNPEGELVRHAKTWIKLISDSNNGDDEQKSSPVLRYEYLTNRILDLYPKVVEPKQQERLERILNDILRTSNIPPTSSGYSITIIDNDDKNAWSLPNGQIFISKGVLKFVQQELDDADDVLAFILGHEVTHIINRDVERSNEAIGLLENIFEAFDLWSLKQSISRVDELYADKNGALLAYRAKYNPIAAIRWWNAAIDADGHLDFFDAHPSLKQRKDTLISYLNADVKTAYGQFRLGVNALTSGDYPKASQKFRHFLAYFPYDKQALNNIGIAHYQNALRKCQSSPHGEWKLKLDIELRTSLPPILFPKTGTKIIDMKEIEAAIYYFEFALRQDRTYKSAHKNMADLLQDIGKFAEAEKEYLAALESDAKYAFAHNGLGVLYCRQKQWKRGIESFRQALKQNPKFPEAQYNYALAYQKTAQKADAIREWNRYLTLDSQGVWANAAREYLAKLNQD